MKNVILILSLIIIALGCEKDITLEVPNVNSVLVVNGIISPSDGVVVDVSSSTRPSIANGIKGIKDAQVNIYEDDHFMGSLSFIPFDNAYLDNPKSYYRNTTLKPSAGKSYRIEVSHSDYNDVAGTTTIPDIGVKPPKLEFLGNDQEGRYQFSVDIEQIDEGKQYYSMILTNRRTPYQIVEGEKLYQENNVDTVYQVFSFAGSDQNDIINTGFDSYRPSTEFFSNTFSDESFNHGRAKIIIEAFGLSYSTDSDDFGLSQELSIQLRQISFDFFEYLRTLSIQETVANDPFASEVVVYNNIENGLGNFGGFNVISSNVLLLDFD